MHTASIDLQDHKDNSSTEPVRAPHFVLCTMHSLICAAISFWWVKYTHRCHYQVNLQSPRHKTDSPDMSLTSHTM